MSEETQNTMSDTTTPETATGNVDVVTNIKTTPEINESNFKDLLSDEYKSHQSLQQYKDLNGLVKSHLELEKTLGDRVKLPNEKSTKEEINKFFNKLGRPEEASKYEFSTPEKLPEGFTIDEKGLNNFKELAHKLGLTNKQANALRENYLNQAIELHKNTYISPEKQEADFAEKRDKLFGDKAEQVIQTTSKLIHENLTKEQADALDKLGNDELLAVTQLLNNISSKFLSPDTVSTNYAPANTADDARNELITLSEKLEKMNKFDPMYKVTNDKINELYAKGVKIF
jgi:DNA-directed RNA polymerase beta subunit